MHSIAKPSRLVRRIVTLSLAAAFLSTAAVASAEPTKKEDNYGYEFKDELLQSSGNGAMGMRIPGIRFNQRDRLIRPRVHFVTEMLKSVENM